MKWLKRGGIALCAIALILAIAPFFISLNDYIPRIEAEASARLQQPVKVKSLRLALLPLPHLIVTEITIGNSADLSAGKVTVTPDLWSLFGPTKVIRSITVDKLVVTQQAFAMIPADGQPAAKPSGGFRDARLLQHSGAAGEAVQQPGRLPLVAGGKPAERLFL